MSLNELGEKGINTSSIAMTLLCLRRGNTVGSIFMLLSFFLNGCLDIFFSLCGILIFLHQKCYFENVWLALLAFTTETK